MAEPQNLVRKLLSGRLLAGELAPGEEIYLAVDQILIEDATGSMTALQFEELGVNRVDVPLAVMYVDHNVLQIDDKNMDEHRYLQTFSARYGIHYSRPGNGISHGSLNPARSSSAPTRTPRWVAPPGCLP
jgi:aconitate hydratase